VLVGEIPDGLTINHENGKKDDNRPENLKPATYSEQMFHAYRVLGLCFGAQPGERNHQAKLTVAQVEAIRQRRSAGETLAAIARDFGIVFQHVSRIVRGKKWGLVKQSETE
jgi:hypothetical protein